MHFETDSAPGQYLGYIRRKRLGILCMGTLLTAFFLAAVSLGAVQVNLFKAIYGFFTGTGSPRDGLILWQIRLPQALTALAAGAGLAGSGAVMQSVLKNPLASPFTLGISHAAAFGAACAVMLMGTGVMASSSADALNISYPALTVGSAFCFSMLTAWLIVHIAGRRGASPRCWY